ncbi:hypothetical protein BDN70DRAFT_900093 [Pholiota conissans]|uniref:WSC domain-containing protein n=1 Tax=Pholiota conissans TaxID=109636 RepID=A0A9P5YNH4_9AGAR|nr:hypothetical protein BDN70DRAFT_900093 [Pholiota conissans]
MKFTNAVYNALCALSVCRGYGHGGTYTSHGCFSDSADHPGLTASKLLNQTKFTTDQCFDFCGAHLYSGLENGRDCYCGDIIEGDSMPISPDACNVLCTGENVECGGVNAIQIFELSDYTPPLPPVLWTPIGCYTTGSYFSATSMALDSCEGFCDAGGFTYAGLEDGTCSGDPDNTCGGSETIEIFEKVKQ